MAYTKTIGGEAREAVVEGMPNTTPIIDGDEVVISRPVTTLQERVLVEIEVR